ncbi:hypothetical protein ACQJBY_049839 [Aegilops geniculata]
MTPTLLLSVSTPTHPGRPNPLPPHHSLSLIPKKKTFSGTHDLLTIQPSSSPHDLLATAPTHAGRFRRAPAARNTPPTAPLPPPTP